MTAKITEKMLFSPSFEYVDNGIEHGVLSPFETKEIILEKGQQIAEGFKPLDCSIKMLKDVPVKMRDGITIYTDILFTNNRRKSSYSYRLEPLWKKCWNSSSIQKSI